MHVFRVFLKFCFESEEGPVPKYNSFCLLELYIFDQDMRLRLISLTFIITIMSLKTSLQQLKLKGDVQKVVRECTATDHIQYTGMIYICWIYHELSAPGHT